MRTLSEIWLMLCRRLMRCSSATNTRKLYSPLTEKLQDTELCMPVWMTSMMSPFLPIHPKHCGATVFRKGHPALQATVRKPDVPSHHNILLNHACECQASGCLCRYARTCPTYKSECQPSKGEESTGTLNTLNTNTSTLYYEPSAPIYYLIGNAGALLRPLIIGP